MIRLKKSEVATIHVIIPAESPKNEIDNNKPVSKKVTPVIWVKRVLDQNHFCKEKLSDT